MKPYVVAPRRKKGEKTKKPHTPQRLLLEQGQLVLELLPRDVSPAKGPLPLCPRTSQWGSWARAVGDDEDASAGKKTRENIWIHLSYINFRTYEMSALKLCPIEPEESESEVRVRVPDALTVATSRELFVDLDFDRAWLTKWHCIKKDSSRLASTATKAEAFSLTPMPDPAIPPFTVWKGAVEEELARARAKAPRARQPGKRGKQQRGQGQKKKPPLAAGSSHSRGGKNTMRLDLEEENEDQEQGQDEDDDSDSEEESESEIDPLDELLESAHQAAMAFFEAEAAAEAPPGASQAAQPKPTSSAPTKAATPPTVATSKATTPNTGSLASAKAKAPPVHPAERKPAESRKKEVVEEVLTLPGGIGDIRYNSRTKVLIAHCNKHGLHTCKRQRAATRPERLTLRNLGQGRPLGLLAAWLLEQDKHEDQSSHVSSSIGLDLQARQNGRDYLKKVQGSEGFFGFERPKGDDTQSEPEFIT